MGQEVADSVTVTEGVPDPEPPVTNKTLEHTYSRELLLSYAGLETCKKVPENLDPHVLRGAPTADSVEGAIAIPAASARGLVRRDRDSEFYSKSPQDIPEWRKDSWRAGGSGNSLQPGPRRKPFDEEPPGNAFSTSYPPRPAANWGDNVHLRNSYDRSGPTLQGQGSGRWDHRVGLGDRERDKGRPVPNWDGDEPVPIPIVVPDGPRTFGGGSPVVRPGWMPAERDGLLGSGGSLHGGGLHRTYTGNFTTPSAIRGGPERHNSMGRINSRTNEPYQPARSLKVVPTFTRREDTDFVNDETFGGAEEISNEERAEQERKRRESFELMRKDHQRRLQEQQKLLSQKQEELLANPEAVAIRKHDENTLWDDTLTGEVLSATSPRSPEKHTTSELKESIPVGGITLSSLTSSTHRPAIPPGFAKVIQQMQTTTKAPTTKETPTEGDSSGKDPSKQVSAQNDSADIPKETVVADDTVKLDDKLVPVSYDSVTRQVGAHTSLPRAMTRADSMKIISSSNEAKETETPRSAVSDTNEERVEGWSFKMDGIGDNKQGTSGDDVKDNIFVGVDEYNKSQESLLDKLFGRTKSGQVPVKDGLLPSHPLADESQNRLRSEEPWTEGESKVSKFAQFFHQEEKQQSREMAAASSDIMLLFPKGVSLKATQSLSKEQPVAEAPRKSNSENLARNHGRVLPMPSGPSLEDIEKGLTANASAAADHEQSVTKESFLLSALSLKNLEVEHKGDQLTGIFGEHSPVGKFKFQPIPPPRTSSSSKSSPVFLTCEDIEQSLLAEAGTNPDKTIPPIARNRDVRAVGHEPNRKGEQGVQAADTMASRHLLSLLQKGAREGHERKQSKRGGLSRNESFGESEIADAEGGGWSLGPNNQEVGGSSKSLPRENPTLEALFGKAFMSELRSTEAPVSSKTFAGDYYGNGDGTQVASGAYLSRQSSGRMNNSASNSNAPKPWLGTIGPLSKMSWSENKMLEPPRLGRVPDLAGPRHKVNPYMVSDHEENRPTSGHGFWGNGVNTFMANGSPPISTGGGIKGSFVSSLESSSFALGAVVDIPPQSKGLLDSLPSSDLDIHTSSKGTVEGENLSSGSFSPVALRASEDMGSTSSQGKVLSGDEPSLVPSSSFDTSGLSKVFKDESLTNRMAGDGLVGKFALTDIGTTSREENTAVVSQGLDSFLSASHKLDRKEISEEISNCDKLGRADELNSGNDRKMTDALSEALGLGGKVKDGNARASTAGIPEQANTGSLSRGSSFSNRFKGGMQQVSGFASFQPNAPPLQHQQSVGGAYRSEPPPALSLPPRQSSSIPVHHHLQQSPSSGSLSMFPPQPFRPQPGLPQQQQLLAPSFTNGGSMEYPHMAFGHGPTAPSRPISGGHLHFPPSPHGHLSPPGAYHPMGPMGPAPNHFIPGAQMPQRGPVMSPMTDAHVFMQEQSLHDPHGLGAKPGPQQGPALPFPLGGHALHSGQGPIFHQPLGHNLRGQHNQLLPVQGPWVPPYGSEFMRSNSKGHESPNFVNGNGGAVGGSGNLDRWFGLELSRNLSGIPTPGLIPLSPHGLESDSKMRFG